MDQLEGEKQARIRELNDALRRQQIGGRVMVTAGLAAQGEQVVLAVTQAVAAFDKFDGDNDPYGEHDCAVVEVGDLRIIWKIDYYDLDLKLHSPDPADLSVTTRVLTIMLASEY